MSWYSEYRNEWKEIIETVARECKRAELMVEKDTVQSMFLLELSKVDADACPVVSIVEEIAEKYNIQAIWLDKNDKITKTDGVKSAK